LLTIRGPFAEIASVVHNIEKVVCCPALQPTKSADVGPVEVANPAAATSSAYVFFIA
jgi:hypothetical protein